MQYNINNISRGTEVDYRAKTQNVSTQEVYG